MSNPLRSLIIMKKFYKHGKVWENSKPIEKVNNNGKTQ